MRNRNGTSGQATVEFALILPLVIILALSGTDLIRCELEHRKLEFASRECALYGARHFESDGISEILAGASALACDSLGTVPDDPDVQLSMSFDTESVHVTLKKRFTPLFITGSGIFGSDPVLVESCAATLRLPGEDTDG